jgi:hypothetical protein
MGLSDLSGCPSSLSTETSLATNAEHLPLGFFSGEEATVAHCLIQFCTRRFHEIFDVVLRCCALRQMTMTLFVVGIAKPE